MVNIGINQCYMENASICQNLTEDTNESWWILFNVVLLLDAENWCLMKDAGVCWCFMKYVGICWRLMENTWCLENVSVCVLWKMFVVFGVLGTV